MEMRKRLYGVEGCYITHMVHYSVVTSDARISGIIINAITTGCFLRPDIKRFCIIGPDSIWFCLISASDFFLQ